MVSERQAQEIKRTYCSASDLEAVGIFPNEEATLTPEEEKALEFINRLDPQQAGNLIHFLGNVESLREKGAEEVFSDQRYERDVARLQEQGLDIHDQQSLAFAYQILSEKLQGSEGHLGDFAKMKALSHTGRVILPQPEEEKPVSLATLSLQDLVEREAKKVERYLTSYFQVVEPLIRDFLPLELEVKGKLRGHVLKLSEDVCKHFSPVQSWGRMYGEESRLRKMYGCTTLSGQKCCCKNEKFPDGVQLIEMPKKHYLFIDARDGNGPYDPYRSLDLGVYGVTIKSPTFTIVSNSKKETKNYVLSWTGFPTRKNRVCARFAEQVFKKEGESITYNDIVKRMGKKSIEQLRLFLGSLVHQLETAESIEYVGSAKRKFTILTRHDVGFEYTAKIDWSAELEGGKPFLYFPLFAAEDIQFSKSQEFWELLHAYANLPVAITKHITETLRENFLEYAPVLLEDLTHQTKEQLGYLRQTIEEVQAKGLLTAEPTAKLLEEALES